MDILIVSYMFPRQGKPNSGIFVLEQAQALSDRGHNIKIISPEPYVPSTISKLLNRPPSSSIPRSEWFGDILAYYPRYWSLPRPETLPLVVYSYRRTLRRYEHLFESADLINAHTALPAGFGSISIAQRLNVPLVTTIHGTDLQHRIHQKIPRHQIRNTLTESDKVVLNSGKLHQIYAENFDDMEKVDVVHNGFATEAALKADPVETSDGAFRIISVGNLVAEKGTRYVLDALADLSFDFEYLIVGDGPLRTDLEEYAADIGIKDKVSFVGEVDHETVFSYLKSADLFVLPSYEEAFGIAYLEAMACGLPVIACEGEGPADYITHRETGFLVPPKQSEPITDLVRELQSNHRLRQHVARRGQQTVFNRFSWERNAREIECVFQEAIETYK